MTPVTIALTVSGKHEIVFARVGAEIGARHANHQRRFELANGLEEEPLEQVNEVHFANDVVAGRREKRELDVVSVDVVVGRLAQRDAQEIVELETLGELEFEGVFEEVQVD